jgi:hypothetical protein
VALVRLTRPDADLNLAALSDRIGRLEREGVAAGAAPTVAPPPADTAAPEAPSTAIPAGTATAPPPGPAASAREVLARRREAQGPTGRPARAAPRPEATSAPPPPPAPVASPSPAPSASGDRAPDVARTPLPTRDELTVAWGDAILPTLGRAKPRWAPGRWLAVEDDVAVFALPNAIHAAKCEEGREHVEATVAAHFGRPVPIRIVVDPGGTDEGARRPSGDETTPPPSDAPDTIDLSELTDATDVAASGVERIAQAFPGAELVDGD